MYKLLIYIWNKKEGQSPSCYCFTFYTIKAAYEAATHFNREDCYTTIVCDK